MTLMTGIISFAVLAIWRAIEFFSWNHRFAACIYDGPNPTRWRSYKRFCDWEGLRQRGYASDGIGAETYNPWAPVTWLMRRRLKPAGVIFVVTLAVALFKQRVLGTPQILAACVAVASVNLIYARWALAFVVGRVACPQELRDLLDSIQGRGRERQLNRLGLTERGFSPGTVEFYPRFHRLLWRLENLVVDLVVVSIAVLAGSLITARLFGQ